MTAVKVVPQRYGLHPPPWDNIIIKFIDNNTHLSVSALTMTAVNDGFPDTRGGVGAMLAVSGGTYVADLTV